MQPGSVVHLCGMFGLEDSKVSNGGGNESSWEDLHYSTQVGTTKIFFLLWVLFLVGGGLCILNSSKSINSPNGVKSRGFFSN